LGRVPAGQNAHFGRLCRKDRYDVGKELFFCDRDHLALLQAATLAANADWTNALREISSITGFWNNEGRILAGLILGHNGQIDRACAMLTEVKFDTLAHQQWSNYLDAMLAANMFEQAIAFCEMNMQNPRARAGVPLRYGRALLRVGRFSEAKKCFQNIADERPQAINVTQELSKIDSRCDEK
jgi:tetratricopeptide (TPR) repeat protein